MSVIKFTVLGEREVTELDGPLAGAAGPGRPRPRKEIQEREPLSSTSMENIASVLPMKAIPQFP
jgi:hypothetical protein